MMHRDLLFASILGLAMTAAHAQPRLDQPGHSIVRTYSWLTLSVPQNVGGLEFSGDGRTLYVAGGSESPSGRIYALPVQRDPATAAILGLGTAVPGDPAPYVDAGMQLGPAGTFFYVTYPSNLLGEISGRTSRTYSSVIPSSPGGMTFVPAGRPRAGELIVGAFTPSRLYRVALVNDGDGFFRPAGSALWADLTSASPHLGSFRFVPTGPWAGDLLVNEYSNHRARLVAIDPATGDPRSPLALTSFVSSIPSPYGIAFDPVTCDLFVSSWSSGQMWQIAGFPRPGPLTANVATLPTAPVARTDFGLHLGAARAGRNYYLLASVSGSSPGLPIGGGVVLPLIPDNVTLALFFAANDPSCRQFFGVADAAGEASASLALAGVPAGLIGARVTFAYASLQPEPFASNAVTLLVVP